MLGIGGGVKDGLTEMSTWNEAAVLLMLMCFFGCGDGSSTGNNGPQETQEPQLIVNGTEFDSTAEVAGKLTLHFPVGTTSQQKALLVDAVTRQLDAFEGDWGSPTIPTSVFIFNEDFVSCAGAVSGGCFYTANNHIHVTMGMFFAAWGVYLELVHLNIPRHDIYHGDPRWDSLWGPIQHQLWLEIVADHRIILGN